MIGKIVTGKSFGGAVRYLLGKEQVATERLHGPEQLRHRIYDHLREVLPECATWTALAEELAKRQVATTFVHRGGDPTKEIQGVTFTLDGHTFKASQVDRKFSYGRLTQRIEQNRFQQTMIERVRNYTEEQRPQIAAILQKLEAEKQQRLEPPHRDLSIAGKPLTREQIEMLREGEPIFVRGTQSEGYVVMDDRLQMAWVYRDDPRDWVEYGKYTMRRMDRDRIEAGYVVRALVKWWGGTTARPYLWKENASDTTYRESWDDPREPRPSQNQKQQDRPRRFITPKKKSRGPSR